MDWRNNPDILNYITHVENDCREHNIQLIITDKEEDAKIGDIVCSGYFDQTSRKLVATTIDAEDPNRWVQVLCHEHNHLWQMVEKDPVWTNTDIAGSDVNTIIDLWLSHKIELNEDQLKDYINRIIAMELDCEKRTVETFKKFNLPYDIDEYIQRSNAYVLMYQMARKHRKWSIYGKAPAGQRIVYSQLSTKFDMNYFEYLSPELEEIFKFSFFEPTV